MGWAYEHLYTDLTNNVKDKLNLFDSKKTLKFDAVTQSVLSRGTGEVPVGKRTAFLWVNDGIKIVSSHEIKYVIKRAIPFNNIEFQNGETEYTAEVLTIKSIKC